LGRRYSSEGNGGGGRSAGLGRKDEGFNEGGRSEEGKRKKRMQKN
jgi:hypothetical protein